MGHGGWLYLSVSLGLLLVSNKFIVDECFTRKDELPFGLIMFYTLAAAGLGSLNFYWFSLMIRSVTSRFKERRPNPPSAFANQAPSKEKEKKKELKRD